jgi:hypothetical protein
LWASAQNQAIQQTIAKEKVPSLSDNL